MHENKNLRFCTSYYLMKLKELNVIKLPYLIQVIISDQKINSCKFIILAQYINLPFIFFETIIKKNIIFKNIKIKQQLKKKITYKHHQT